MKEVTTESADNQYIARLAGYRVAFKNVNIQYKEYYVLDISFLFKQKGMSSFIYLKSDFSELVVLDWDLFVNNMLIIPGLFEIPEGMKDLYSRELSMHNNPAQFEMIAKEIDAQLMHSISYEENTDKRHVIRYKDPKTSRHLAFDAPTKFKCLANFAHYQLNGTRTGIAGIEKFTKL